VRRHRSGLGVYGRLFAAHRRLIAVSATTAVAWQLVALTVPLVLGWVVERGLERSDRTVIWLGALAVLALAAAEAVSDGWRHHAENHAMALASAMLRQHLVDATLAGPGRAADAGDLVARSTNDVREVGTVVDSIGWTLAYVAAVPVAVTALVLTDPRLGLAALATSVVCLSVVGLSSSVWERRGERLQEAVAESFRHVQEALAGLETVHGLGAGPRVRELHGDASREVGRRARDVARLWLWYEPGLRFTTAVAVAGVLWVGGRAVQAGTLSLGDLVAAVGLSLYLVTPVTAIGQQFLAGRTALASANRIADVLTAAAPAAHGDGPVTVVDANGEVLVRAAAGDVVLLGGPGAAEVARSLAGQSFAGAVSGRSGAKPAVKRLRPETSAAYRVCGAGLPALRLEATPFLFAGTLESNLRLARPDATEADLRAAVADADVTRFVPEHDRERDLDLATDLGTRGSRLSGGQRQRVALARALLSRAPVLVVDHGLSGLEPSRQERLLRRLVDLAKDRVLVLVTDHPCGAALATVRADIGVTGDG
jgi:putative ABC transport system ATP-binding protein